MYRYIFCTENDRGYYPRVSVFCSYVLKKSSELWDITNQIGMDLKGIEYSHNGFREVSKDCVEFNMNGSMILATLI